MAISAGDADGTGAFCAATGDATAVFAWDRTSDGCTGRVLSAIARDEPTVTAAIEMHVVKRLRRQESIPQSYIKTPFG
jgi:hypothetical protein